ncbi:MAG: exo-alpha-sialidase, partial [FCB group bacterium]|nr:exo-alpha-sialidase [FCB group bacterium]
MSTLLASIIVAVAAAQTEAPYHITVAPVGPDNPRNSEAAIISLKDGSLLLGGSDFDAGRGEDHGPGRLSAKTTKDG